MIIGVPKEIKNHEYRVSLVPSGVKTLIEHGHKVRVQSSAGEGSGVSDQEYLNAGAIVVPTPEAVYKESEMILKVKEPLPPEYPLLMQDQVLFTYLHLAPDPGLTRALLDRRVIGFAYETVQASDGSLPLLTPMSEIAGKLSIQIGAHYLEKENGGSGVMLGGVPGVHPGHVVIIGGGTVGLNAAKIARGMGARVSLLDINLDKLRYLDDILEGSVTLLASNSDNIADSVASADVVVGGVLVPGARARKLVTRDMISRMRKGSVLVDVAIDQGGCFETSVPTTLDQPVFLLDGVIHYCVSNIPSCVARTSTFALTNATFPFALKLADMGYKDVIRKDPALRKGLNVFKGLLTNKPVAEAVGIEYTPVDSLFAE